MFGKFGGWLRLFAGVMVVAMLAACGSPQPTPLPPATSTPVTGARQNTAGAVSASGVVVPAQKATLGFEVAGVVDTVNVKVGDRVQAGQALAQLKGRENLEASVARAKLDVALAQQEVVAAQQEAQNAQIALVNAQKAVTDMTTPTAAALNLAQNQTDIANLQKQIDDAGRNLRYLTSPDLTWYQDQVARAQDNLTITLQTAGMTDLQMAVTAARDAVAQRQIELTDALNREGWGGAKAVLDAQKNYDLAIDTLKNAELRLAQAQIANSGAITDAQKKLDDARKALNTVLAGPDAIKVAQAQASLALLQAQLAQAQNDREKLKANAGVDPNKLKAAQDAVTAAQNRVTAAPSLLTTAQAHLASAQAAVVAAQAASDQLTLNAPFAGTLVSVDVVSGAVVAPGLAVFRLGDLDHLQVETTDLSELDLGGVQVGQSANVYVDALRLNLDAQVARIALQSTTLGGDVVYAVTLDLAEQPAGLRWGMSVKVDLTPK
jgi:multidrug efflux pump subunit AcrA (membrane-fusion protein)